MKHRFSFPVSGPRALAMRIRLLSFSLEREMDRMFAEKKDVTLAQFMLLIPISVHPGVTQRAIAMHRNVTEAAISRQAEALCRKGYIERGRNPAQKRERALYLTAKGKRALRRAAGHADARFKELFARIKPARRQQIVAALDEVIASIGLRFPSSVKNGPPAMQTGGIVAKHGT